MGQYLQSENRCRSFFRFIISSIIASALFSCDSPKKDEPIQEPTKPEFKAHSSWNNQFMNFSCKLIYRKFIYSAPSIGFLDKDGNFDTAYFEVFRAINLDQVSLYYSFIEKTPKQDNLIFNEDNSLTKKIEAAESKKLEKPDFVRVEITVTNPNPDSPNFTRVFQIDFKKETKLTVDVDKTEYKLQCETSLI